MATTLQSDDRPPPCTDGRQFGKPGEHEIDRLLDAPVWILLDPVMGNLEVADCDGHEFATACLLLQGFEGALPEFSLIVPFIPSSNGTDR